MICKIQNKERAWCFLCAAIDCGSPTPIFDVDEDYNPSEIPVNVYRCPRCDYLAGDTLEDVALDKWVTNCSKCGEHLDYLISVDLIVQGMQVVFRKDH